MPGGNGTGPLGMGPMTGRARGFCSGATRPGYEDSATGFGFPFGFGPERGLRGRGLGGGRGWRNRFFATGLAGWQRVGYDPGISTNADSKFEIQSLKVLAESLQTKLNAILERVSEIEKTGEKEQQP